MYNFDLRDDKVLPFAERNLLSDLHPAENHGTRNSKEDKSANDRRDYPGEIASKSTMLDEVGKELTEGGDAQDEADASSNFIFPRCERGESGHE